MVYRSITSLKETDTAAGFLERLNGRVSEVLNNTRFRNSSELRDTLMRYVKVYNRQIPQKTLGYRSTHRGPEALG